MGKLREVLEGIIGKILSKLGSGLIATLNLNYDSVNFEVYYIT